MPPELKLIRNEAGRVAVIDTGTPDEREFTSHEALRAYVRRCVVLSLTVRRDGWTLPDPEDARIEPDSARLLLRPGNPVIDIVASIGMDRSLDAAHLRYTDSRDQMQRFDHHVHQLEDQYRRDGDRLGAPPCSTMSRSAFGELRELPGGPSGRRAPAERKAKVPQDHLFVDSHDGVIIQAQDVASVSCCASTMPGHLLEGVGP